MGCFGSKQIQEPGELQTTQTEQRRPKKIMSENDKAVIELKQVRDTLNGKTKQLESQIENTETTIKKLILEQKKRDRAKFYFEKKKLYEKYLSEIETKNVVINKMIIEVDKAGMDQECAQAMKQANKFLQDIQNTLKLEDLQEMKENQQEHEQQQQQYNEYFKEYAVGNNEEELEKEYNQMEAQIVDNIIHQNDIQPNIDENLVQQQQAQEQQQQVQPQQQQQQQPKLDQQQQQNQQELDDMLA